jgi:hypothetical protein
MDYYAKFELISGDSEYYEMSLYTDLEGTAKVNITGTSIYTDFFMGAYNMGVWDELDVGDKITISLSTTTFTPESEYTLSNSLNLSNLNSFILDVGTGYPDIRTGDYVYLYSDESTLLPTGLSLDTFYRIISLGNGYVRFVSLESEFNTSNYITLSNISLAYGKLHIDFFSDFNQDYELTGSSVFYKTSSDYYDCINLADTIITGNDIHPGGYATGTKVFFTLDTAELPFDTSIYYYIVRILGTDLVKFSLTRSSALSGNTISFTGSKTGGTLTISAYNTPEEDLLRGYLEEFRVAGQQILFSDPIEYLLTTSMTVVIDPTYEVSAIKTAIRDVFMVYQYRMGLTLHIGDIHKKIVNIDGVLRAYIEDPVSDIELSSNEYFKIDPDILSGVQLLSGNNATYIAT